MIGDYRIFVCAFPADDFVDPIQCDKSTQSARMHAGLRWNLFRLRTSPSRAHRSISTALHRIELVRQVEESRDVSPANSGES